MNIKAIHNIFVIGSGTMGQQIGLQCAMHTYDVVIYDILPEALQTAEKQIKTYAALLTDQKRLTQSQAEQALGHIRFSNNPLDAAGADLVSESVPEDPH